MNAPEMCVNTGRLLTEWFEYPVFTKQQLREQGMKELGVDEYPEGDPFNMPKEGAAIQRKISAYVSGKRRRKWKNTMSIQEIHYRMNEATKMIDPDNFKFLNDDIRERTGLEINPLWMMECLVRSGLLAPKEQVTALKELSQYTHSKAPNINLNSNSNVNPEDWLLELAKDEYKVLGVDIEIPQPLQPVERGAGKNFEKNLLRRTIETVALTNFASAELDRLDDAEVVTEIDWSNLPDGEE